MHDKDNNFAAPNDTDKEKTSGSAESKDTPTTLICPQCKHPARIEDDPKFCIKCGYNFKAGSAQPSFNQPPPYNTWQPQGMPYNYPPQMRGNMPTPVNYTQGGMPPNVYPPQTYAQTIDPPNQMPGYYPPPFPMYPFRKPKTWSLGGGFGVSIFALVLSALVSLGLGLLILLTTGNITSPGAVLFMGSASLLFFLWPLYWVQKYYPRPMTFKERLTELGLPVNKYTHVEIGRELLLGALLGLLGVFLVILLQLFASYVVYWTYGIDITGLISESELDEFDFITPGNAWSLTAFILLMLLFVGLPEEILFRGFVQRSFEARMGRAPATYLTAVYFAIIHIFIYILVPPIFIFLLIPYLGISILLGLVRNWRKDIFACISLHIIYNIAQTVVLYTILS